ncbi:MAG: hypothetical protein R8L53_07300 [Mariprofundales bacterium]
MIAWDLGKAIAKLKNGRVTAFDKPIDAGVPRNDQTGIMALRYDPNDIASLATSLKYVLPETLLVDDSVYAGKRFFDKHLNHLHVVLNLDDYNTVLYQVSQGLSGKELLCRYLILSFEEGVKNNTIRPAIADTSLRVHISRNGVDGSPSYPELQSGQMLLIARPNLFIQMPDDQCTHVVAVRDVATGVLHGAKIFAGQLQSSVGSSYWDNITLDNTAFPPLFFAFRSEGENVIEDVIRDKGANKDMDLVVGLRQPEDGRIYDYWLKPAAKSGGKNSLLRTLQGSLEQHEELLVYQIVNQLKKAANTQESRQEEHKKTTSKKVTNANTPIEPIIPKQDTKPNDNATNVEPEPSIIPSLISLDGQNEDIAMSVVPEAIQPEPQAQLLLTHFMLPWPSANKVKHYELDVDLDGNLSNSSSKTDVAVTFSAKYDAQQREKFYTIKHNPHCNNIQYETERGTLSPSSSEMQLHESLWVKHDNKRILNISQTRAELQAKFFDWLLDTTDILHILPEQEVIVIGRDNAYCDIVLPDGTQKGFEFGAIGSSRLHAGLLRTKATSDKAETWRIANYSGNFSVWVERDEELFELAPMPACTNCDHALKNAGKDAEQRRLWLQEVFVPCQHRVQSMELQNDDRLYIGCAVCEFSISK